MIWSTNPKPNQVNAIDFYTHHDPNHSMRLVHLPKFKMKFWPHDHQTVPGPSSLGAKWFRCRASRTAPRLDLSFTLWLRMISTILAVQLKDKTFCLYFGKRIYNLASVHCGHRMVRLERHTDSMSNKICSDVTTLIVHTGCVSCVMCFCNPIISGNWLPYRNPITEVQTKTRSKTTKNWNPKKAKPQKWKTPANFYPGTLEVPAGQRQLHPACPNSRGPLCPLCHLKMTQRPKASVWTSLCGQCGHFAVPSAVAKAINGPPCRAAPGHEA